MRFSTYNLCIKHLLMMVLFLGLPSGALAEEDWFSDYRNQGSGGSKSQSQSQSGSGYSQPAPRKKGGTLSDRVAAERQQEALAYIYGHPGYPRNYSKAAMLAEQLYEDGGARGALVLAKMYKEGRGVPKNGEGAAYWYKQAALLGSASGAFSLGALYEKGDGVVRDLSVALYWYNYAVNLKFKTAKSSARTLTKSGYKPRGPALPGKADQRPKSISGAARQQAQRSQQQRRVTQQAKAGPPPSPVYGRYPLIAQYTKQTLTDQKCQRRNWAALNFEQGRNGVQMNHETAEDFYVMAGRNGCKLAQANLGNFYSRKAKAAGDDDAKARPLRAKALYWYYQAAVQKNALAESQVGLNFAFGVFGVERDYQQSLYWLRRAAAQGHASSQMVVGLHYLEGWGVAKNKDIANHWFKQAARNGNPEARKRLKRQGISW